MNTSAVEQRAGELALAFILEQNATTVLTSTGLEYIYNIIVSFLQVYMGNRYPFLTDQITDLLQPGYDAPLKLNNNNMHIVLFVYYKQPFQFLRR